MQGTMATHRPGRVSHPTSRFTNEPQKRLRLSTRRILDLNARLTFSEDANNAHSYPVTADRVSQQTYRFGLYDAGRRAESVGSDLGRGGGRAQVDERRGAAKA
jgi:hypothetical protein